MSTAAWTSCLDRFGEHLHMQRDALAAGRPELITAFVPSPELDALPVGLLARAQALQAQAEALTAAICEAQTRAQAARAALRRPPEPAPPAYVDSRT